MSSGSNTVDLTLTTSPRGVCWKAAIPPGTRSDGPQMVAGRVLGKTVFLGGGCLTTMHRVPNGMAGYASSPAAQRLQKAAALHLAQQKGHDLHSKLSFNEKSIMSRLQCCLDHSGQAQCDKTKVL